MPNYSWLAQHFYDSGYQCGCQLIPIKEPNILQKFYNAVLMAFNDFVEFEEQLNQISCLTIRKRRELNRVIKKYSKDFKMSKKKARDEIEYQLYMGWIK